MSTTFAQLGLPEPLARALHKQGITEPFPIQTAAIPDAMRGHDISGKAPTGSGKTLAFGLPMLARVGQAQPHRPRALVLAPTRELAQQITKELVPAARAAHRVIHAVHGGVRYSSQRHALRKGVDVLVATPGRLEDLIEQGTVDLGMVEIAVIDEADRMADMGFLPAVRRILDHTSNNRQTLLFSATLDGDIAALSREYQNEPVGHEAGTVEPETSDARHHFWLVNQHDRVGHTADVLTQAGRSIVFTRTRHGADRLARQLSKLGVDAVALHGGRSQNQRNRALKAFSAGNAHALVATDVAARGIHIDAVAAVVHFDPPGEAKDYLHRSGRTARAGAAGTVVSLVTSGQRRDTRRMQEKLGLNVPIGTPDVAEILHGGHSMKRSPTPEMLTTTASRPSVRKERTRKKRRPTEKSQSVYIANLPWSATTPEVEALFGRYGEVNQATIITNKHNGKSKGFGFVDMPAAAAKTAVDALHGFRLDGRDLTVRFAKPRRYGN